MTKELEVNVEKAVELASQHIKVTPFGMEFEGKPSTEEWMNAFQKVAQLHGMSQFYLGDLVVEAEYEWGDKYTELIALTGYAYDTLARCANIARRFPASFRKEIVGRSAKNRIPAFNSFKEVQSVDDEKAMYFLQMVNDGNWTNDELVEAVKRSKNGGSLPEPRVKEEKFIADGWENVKQYGYGGYVPNIIDGEVEELTFLAEVTESEAESLIDHLKGNMRFSPFVEKLIAGLRGLNQL